MRYTVTSDTLFSKEQKKELESLDAASIQISDNRAEFVLRVGLNDTLEDQERKEKELKDRVEDILNGEIQSWSMGK